MTFQIQIMPMLIYVGTLVYGIAMGHPWIGMGVGFAAAWVHVLVSWVVLWRLEFGEWTFWKL